MTDSEDRSNDSASADEPMADPTRLDDLDEIVSAVLDGEASPEDVRRLADQPELQARLDVFRAVAGRVGAPVEDMARVDVDRIVNAALSAFGERDSAAASAASPAAVTALAGRDRLRPTRRRRWEWAAGAAAALVVAIGVLVALTSSRHTSTPSTAALSHSATAATPATVDPGVKAGAAAAAAPSSTGATTSSPGGATPRAASDSGGAARSTGSEAGSQLGTFADQDALMASLSARFGVPPAGDNQNQAAPTPPTPTMNAAPTTNPATSAAPASRDSAPGSGPVADGGTSCNVAPGLRALGIAVVGGTRMLIARHDASGRVLGYNAATCALVFDRTP